MAFESRSCYQLLIGVLTSLFSVFREQLIKLDSSLLACGDFKLKWNVLKQPTTLIILQASFNFVHSPIIVESRVFFKCMIVTVPLVSPKVIGA